MKVNGKEIGYKGNESIVALLNNLKVKEERVVIELNGTIIAKEDFSKVNLQEDDTVEVISFVGGG